MKIELKEMGTNQDRGKMFLVEEPIVDDGTDYSYYLVVDLESTAEWGDQPEYEVHVSVKAVSPEASRAGELDSALRAYGYSREEFDEFPLEGQLELLAESGLNATLVQFTGMWADEVKLLERVKEELPNIEVLFGFHMDKPQNAIGSSGWDFVRGDIMGGLKKQMKL